MHVTSYLTNPFYEKKTLPHFNYSFYLSNSFLLTGTKFIFTCSIN